MTRSAKITAIESVKNLALSLIAIATFPVAAPSQVQTGAPAGFPAELDRYISAVVADWKIPGVAIAIVRNDSTLVAKGYGVRELGKPGRVDENTVFDIASLSKAFTATAAAILVDRGKLRWDDPVHRHLPAIVLPSVTLTEGATVRDFLSHRTGLEAHNMMWVPTAVNRAEVLRRMRFVRAPGEMGKTMIYSNIGYSVAGEAMAAAAGVPFESLLRDLVIKPLGLTSTTWTYDQAASMPNVASAHATIAGTLQPVRRELQRQSIAPAAGVQSSVHDLARWMRFQLNDGTLDGRRFVSDSNMRITHTRQVVIPTTAAMRAARQVQDTIAGYGLGWQIMDYRGHPLLWHSGNGDGQIAYMALLPREKLGVVVLVNTWSAPMVHEAIVKRTLDTYLGYPLRDWAGEAFARIAPTIAANDSASREMQKEMAKGSPSRALGVYVGRYDEPLFGPIFVRLEKSGLVLQMGDGQKADLVVHSGDSFMVRWRDALFREYYESLLQFNVIDAAATSFTVRLNRDAFTAKKSFGNGSEARP